MEIKIRICCAPIPKNRCVQVKKTLNDKFPKRVTHDDGIYEHTARAFVNSHKDAIKLMHELRVESKGQIGAMDYDVIHN